MLLVVYVFTLLIFTIFLSSGVSKILTFSSFLTTISLLTGIKNPIVKKGIAITIIFSEIVCSILILIPSFKKISIASLIIMLIIFTLIILINLLKSTKVMCNCGGVLGNNQISWMLPFRNIIIIIISYIIFITPNSIGIHEINKLIFIESLILILFYTLRKIRTMEILLKREGV